MEVHSVEMLPMISAFIVKNTACLNAWDPSENSQMTNITLNMGKD